MLMFRTSGILNEHIFPEISVFIFLSVLFICWRKEMSHTHAIVRIWQYLNQYLMTVWGCLLMLSSRITKDDVFFWLSLI